MDVCKLLNRITKGCWLWWYHIHLSSSELVDIVLCQCMARDTDNSFLELWSHCIDLQRISVLSGMPEELQSHIHDIKTGFSTNFFFFNAIRLKSCQHDTHCRYDTLNHIIGYIYCMYMHFTYSTYSDIFQCPVMQSEHRILYAFLCQNQYSAIFESTVYESVMRWSVYLEIWTEQGLSILLQQCQKYWK